mmetsp:Transcript_8430/g.7962  ORF Transcript_8430/g.7962 Transcript_8430/m.7962 type:complete len:257 (+) Transcript_8430:1-771(+)
MCIGPHYYGHSRKQEEANFRRDTLRTISETEELKIDDSRISGDSFKTLENTSVSDSNFEKGKDGITNVSFYDPIFFLHRDNPSNENYHRIHRFLLHLALCHTVIIEETEVDNKTQISYNANSPDELALVNGARFFGYFFCKRDNQNNMIVRMENGVEESYELLNVIEFDSARKRMTVIVRCPNNDIKVMCKGADSIIYPRLKSREFVQETDESLEKFAAEGLRTLLLAEKTITEQEYYEWEERYREATLEIIDREK